jgi:hypothetical protein
MPKQSIIQLFDLESIFGVPFDSSNLCDIKALVIVSYDRGKEIYRQSQILDFLSSLDIVEYGKIILSMNLIAKYGKSCSSNHFKGDRKERKIYEIRISHGNSRILCFFDKFDKILICSNSYKKSKGGLKA